MGSDGGFGLDIRGNITTWVKISLGKKTNVDNFTMGYPLWFKFYYRFLTGKI